jgi:predicted Zn-dependent peptidase
MAVGILSGGMAGRLFIEVREKRGLVYRVSASHSAARKRAAIICYAGTTTDRADETLQVMVNELRNLSKGVSEEELQRAKADLKSRIIMSSESSSARAGAIISDYWNLDRVRSLEEIKASIDKVSSQDIERHLNEFPVKPITLVTLGQKGLSIPQ